MVKRTPYLGMQTREAHRQDQEFTICKNKISTLKMSIFGKKFQKVVTTNEKTWDPEFVLSGHHHGIVCSQCTAGKF
ncbi:hypothetical protein NDU88_008290 [Pleurodeles waltl]|uniref:Uncharacterized protein n=1 Tax=Pleurodeles waltl TaxID=8319 RepID=A0AAV7RVD3_PLEWA|nr:hypothetical protein NDU88_008290 [Pleurodeles waltl]